jgi:hypothetical protein
VFDDVACSDDDGSGGFGWFSMRIAGWREKRLEFRSLAGVISSSISDVRVMAEAKTDQ